MFPLVCLIIHCLFTDTNIMPTKSFKTFLIEQNAQTDATADYHKRFHENLQTQFGKEYPVIMNALSRNAIPDTDYENVALAFSIRRAEAGRQGKEFGVLAPGAGMKPGETPEQTLDRQAGWAGASIVKNRQRYKEGNETGDFIQFMGNRWAPIGVANDPTNLNKNWVKNVSKFHSSFMNCTGPNCPKPEQVAIPQEKKQETNPPQQPNKETQQQSSEDYVIKPGDSFWKVGGNTQEGMDKLIQANPGVDPNKLKPGQKIKMPRQ